MTDDDSGTTAPDERTDDTGDAGVAAIPTGDAPDEPEGTSGDDEPVDRTDATPSLADFVPRGRHEPDPDELVGPGRFPLRIHPAAAIAPGTADSKRLLAIWFVRKSFYWLFFLGIAVGFFVQAARHESDVDVDASSPAALTTAWAGIGISLIVRFVAGWIALGLAFPLALAHEPSLSPRTNFGSGIGRFFDRLHIARAFRSLRWTHHVRQVAQRRLGRTGERLGKLDPIFDIVNIASAVIAIISLFVFAVAAQPG